MCQTQKEIDDIVKVGYLNAIFVLARSIGLIGMPFVFVTGHHIRDGSRSSLDLYSRDSSEPSSGSLC